MTEMSPIDWALRPLGRYADFRGRAPRAEYWWYTLAAGLVGFSVDYLEGAFGRPMIGIYGPVSLLLTCALLVPGIAVTVRRLHDIGRTGWWTLLNVGSYLFLVVGLLASNPEQLFDSSWIQGLGVGALLALALGYIGLGIVMLVFMVTRGADGPNRYGPDPYGPDHLEEVFA